MMMHGLTNFKNESVCSTQYRTKFLDRLTNHQLFGEELQLEFSNFSLKPYFCKADWRERYSLADLLEGDLC
jgi:hypothetical protein